MFDSPDDTLTKVITNIFDTSKLIMAPLQRQSPGSNNCGIFAIAMCMVILLEEDPSEIKFKGQLKWKIDLCLYCSLVIITMNGMCDLVIFRLV